MWIFVAVLSQFAPYAVSITVRKCEQNFLEVVAQSSRCWTHWFTMLFTRFTHGFMMGMLQLKMLKSQKSFLKDRIQKLKDSLETQKRHEGFKVQYVLYTCKREAYHHAKYICPCTRPTVYSISHDQVESDPFDESVSPSLQKRKSEGVVYEALRCTLTLSPEVYTPFVRDFSSI